MSGIYLRIKILCETAVFNWSSRGVRYAPFLAMTRLIKVIAIRQLAEKQSTLDRHVGFSLLAMTKKSGVE